MINIILGIVRTKVMAVLLGPAGVGLAGVYASIASLATVAAGMGLNGSGVRQIAQASSTGDEERVGRTTQALRRTALVLGLVGACCVAGFAPLIARITFGDTGRSSSIALLGFAVAFGAVSAGQMALIQGLRRISDLAKLNILGALVGTLVGLPVIWIFRERGIIPLLILVPAAGLVFSWWFARQVPIPAVRLTARQTVDESRALLGLGITFMTSALLTAAVAYMTRLLILRQLGLGAAGQYTAAFTLSGIYAGFILQAMGADFYPRLTAVADNHDQVNALVNEQAEVALLVALPGALATLAFAPWVVKAFYAADFLPAVIVLQWQVLGVLGRVISWPIGFILLAKGRSALFLISEVFAATLHVLLILALVPQFGLEGAGIAFAALYVFVTLFVLFLATRLTGFRWNTLNRRIIVASVLLVFILFVLSTKIQTSAGVIVGGLISIAVAAISAKMLLRRVPPERLGRFAAWVQ